MPEMLRYETDEGYVIHVEGVGAPSIELAAAAPSKQLFKLSGALEELRPIVSGVKRALDTLELPDVKQVEIGLGFKGEVGVFLASGEANASIKVTFSWK